LFSKVGGLGRCVLSLPVTYLIVSFPGICVGGLGRAILLVRLGAVQILTHV